MKKVLLPVAALAMAATPVVASASDAVRASEPAQTKAEIGGSSVIIAILAAAAVIAGIIVATDDDEDDLPVSV